MGPLMQKIRLSSIFLSFFFLSTGSLIGWLAGEDVIKREGIHGFLQFLIAIPAIIFLFQISIYRDATRWLQSQLKFLGSISLTLAWFMVSLALPIFWSELIGIYPKLLILMIFAILCIANIQFSKQSFNKKWSQTGQSAFDKLFEPKTTRVDWEKIIRSMKHDFDIYIPGLSKKLSNFVAILAAAVLVIGHFIREIYPVYSMLAWAFSFSIGASWCCQIGVYNFMHAKKVRALEKKYNIQFESA